MKKETNQPLGSTCDNTIFGGKKARKQFKKEATARYYQKNKEELELKIACLKDKIKEKFPITEN